MDPAFTALLGALIGAGAGVLATIIAGRLQVQRERELWLLSHKEEAYSKSLFSLSNALRRALSVDSARAIIRPEQIKDFFNDLNDAFLWLNALSIYCASEQRETISRSSEALGKALDTSKAADGLSVMDQMSRPLSPQITEIIEEMAIPRGFTKLAIKNLPAIYADLLSAARSDLTREIPRR